MSKGVIVGICSDCRYIGEKDVKSSSRRSDLKCLKTSWLIQNTRLSSVSCPTFKKPDVEPFIVRLIKAIIKDDWSYLKREKK